MATIQELNDKIAEVNTNVSSIKIKVTELINAMSAAFGRLLAQIQAGQDTQPQIDALNAIGSELNDISSSLDSGKAQADLEGQ